MHPCIFEQIIFLTYEIGNVPISLSSLQTSFHNLILDTLVWVWCNFDANLLSSSHLVSDYYKWSHFSSQTIHHLLLNKYFCDFFVSYFCKYIYLGNCGNKRGSIRVPEKEFLRSLIQLITANGLRHASAPFHPPIRYIYAIVP